MSVRSLFLLMGMILGLNSFAAQPIPVGCDSIRCLGKVEKLYVHEIGIYIKMDQDMNSLACNPAVLGSEKFMTLKTDHPYRSEIYSTLLAAHLSQGPNVLIRITESSSTGNECFVKYITSEI